MIRKIILVAFVMLAIPVIGILVLLTRASWNDAAALAERSAAGMPVAISDLRPEPIDDADNAAIALRKVLAAGPTTLSEDASADQPNRDAEAKQLRDAINLPRHALPIDYDASPTIYQRQLLDALSETSDAARRLAFHLSDLGERIAAADVNDAEGGIGGKLVEAYVADVRALHRLANDTERGPALIAYLKGVGIRQIAWQQTESAIDDSAFDRSALQAMITAAGNESSMADRFVESIDSEAAFALESFQDVPGVPRVMGILEGGFNAKLIEIFERFKTAALDPNADPPPIDNQFAGSLLAAPLKAGFEGLRRNQTKLNELRQRMANH